MTHPASTDAVVAAVLVLMGNTVSAILIHPTARAANAVACALSAAVLIATQTQTYHRHRNVMAVMYRLVIPVLSQISVSGLTRYPNLLPTPPTVKGWIGFFAGRVSPMIASLLAASARLPPLATAALSLAMLAEYIALQPSACAALFLNSRGIDAYFNVIAAKLSAGSRAVVAATVGYKSLQAPPPPPPCPPQACFAAMTMLHAAAIVGAAFAAARGRPRGRAALAWGATAAAALAAAAPLLVGRPPAGGCPRSWRPHHPMSHLQLDPGAPGGGGLLSRLVVGG